MRLALNWYRWTDMHAWFAVPASPAVAGSGVPLDRYLVFCKLLRAGYIVQASWGGGGGGGGGGGLGAGRGPL